MNQTPRLDVELLACHALGMDRVQLHVQANRELSARELELLEPLLERRLAREPVQYITGRAWFRNLEVVVDERVLIPRPESELLVEWSLEEIERIRGERPDHVVRVLDLCTGSGAIAAAIADEAPAGSATVTGSELSAEALEVARLNVAAAGVEVELVEGDLFEPLAGRTFDVVVTNPPYVPMTAKSSMSPTVRDFEPHIALFVPGEDTLWFTRRILDAARTHLVPGGLLAMEIGAAQEDPVSDAFREHGFTDVTERRDLAGIVRTIGGRRGAGGPA